ncbi:hypothetical protein BN946_scf184943.g23 [Trametes cinnabarina]|uniref:Uncharacterized protein n=1 Tax=Pycnoporus cinnabarinus TaxID=5643 RepID=A0A060SHT1_PYCCI|nr:hypothetical protein BN946_scf184943.g23 [Trametes cinnabarina]
MLLPLDYLAYWFGMPAAEYLQEGAVSETPDIKRPSQSHMSAESTPDRAQEADPKPLKGLTVEKSTNEQECEVRAESEVAQHRPEEMAPVLYELDARMHIDRAAPLEKDLKQATAQISELQHTAKTYQGRLRATLALLETKIRELHDAQTFLTKVDDVSDNDVVDLVERLNSRIHQTAANIADKFRKAYGRVVERDTSRQQMAIDRLMSSRLLSMNLLHSMRHLDHKRDTVLVQIALQAVLVAYTKQSCDTWAADGELHMSLIQIYSRMHGKESQSVAGRWRALARTYLNAVSGENDDVEERKERKRSLLSEHLADVLIACGVRTPADNVQKTLFHDFSSSLYDVISIAVEFQTVTGERVVSHDLLASTVDPGIRFVPERMDDDWSNPGPSRISSSVGQTVQCTTHLGLTSNRTLDVSSSTAASGARPFREVILLKPKVVLDTTLNQLHREQSQGQFESEGRNAASSREGAQGRVSSTEHLVASPFVDKSLQLGIERDIARMSSVDFAPIRVQTIPTVNVSTDAAKGEAGLVQAPIGQTGRLRGRQRGPQRLLPGRSRGAKQPEACGAGRATGGQARHGGQTSIVSTPTDTSLDSEIELDKYTPGPPGIKVSLGLSKSVHQFQGMIGTRDKEPADLNVHLIWRYFGHKVERENLKCDPFATPAAAHSGSSGQAATQAQAQAKAKVSEKLAVAA